MKITAEVIEGLVGSVLASRYDDPVPTPVVHREWWGMCCSENKLVSIAAPRYHAKSTAITHAYLMAELLFKHSDFAMIVSDTEGQAKEFLNDIIIDLSSNDDLISLFEIEGFDKDTETAIVVKFKDGDRFKVIAKGAGQKVRGTKWDQKRPNLIIIDDLENDENTQTKEQRSKLKRWVNAALIPCMSRRGRVRAVGTILHTDSWLNSTMPDESSPLTVKAPLKVSSTRLSKGWYSALYSGHPGIGDYSQFLWPEYRNREFFEAEFNRLAEDGQQDVYSQEQLNRPIDETNAYFKKTDFRDFPNRPKVGEYVLPELQYFGAMDLAISKADRADYSAHGIVGVDETGLLWLVKVIRERLDGDENASTIFQLERDYHPGFFLVERGAMKHVVAPILTKDMEKKHLYPQLKDIATSGDKRTKARSMQKIMRGGGIVFDKQAEWYPAFEDELLRFDRGRNDDQVDMLALFGLKVDELYSAPTEDEKQEEEWDDEYGQEARVGRDSLTGY